MTEYLRDLITLRETKNVGETNEEKLYTIHGVAENTEENNHSFDWRPAKQYIKCSKD